MKTSNVPQSGRHGVWVYYMFRGKQCRRRWIRPRDPRTPLQLQARRVFGTASNLWSVSPLVTEEEQDACYAAGAKMMSRPRLDASGPLTGPQCYIGKICKGAARIRGKKTCRTKRTRFDTQVLEPEKVTRRTSGTDGALVGNPRAMHGSSQGRAGRAIVTSAPSQGPWYQRVMQPARGYHRTGFVVLRRQRRCGKGSAREVARVGALHAPGSLAGVGRNNRRRRLWNSA
jgi:hypothetical protein